MKASQRMFLKYVQEIQPKSVKDLRPKYHPRFIAEGAYRQAFDVRVGRKSLGLVIKFPLTQKWAIKDSLKHARDEVNAIERIKTDHYLVALRRYMPAILYHDSKHGVTVMPKYTAIPRWTMLFSGFASTFDCMLADLIPEMRYEFDSGHTNFGLDTKKCYVLLDAGLIGAIRKTRHGR